MMIKATNFLHEMVLTESGVCENIVCKENGIVALEYLNDLVQKDSPLPEIVFLDINMPKMNGWEFIEKYKEFPKEIREQMVVLMLTTSINILDIQKSETIEEIAGYINKPLEKAELDKIIDNYFK